MPAKRVEYSGDTAIPRPAVSAAMPGARRARMGRVAPPAPPDAVLLDAYGTLIHLDDPVGRLTRRLAEAGFPARADQVAAAFAAEVAHYRRHQDRGRDPASLRTLREECGRVLAAALPGAVPPSVATEALAGSLAYRLYGDVVPALDGLRARGMRLVVVSNWDASLPGILRDLGIADRLDHVVVSALAGARKPDPAIFLRAARALGLSPARLAHVGNDPAADVAGAAAAGIRAVLIDREASARGRPGVVASLAELPFL